MSLATYRVTLAAALLLLMTAFAHAEVIRLDVTRDTWVSSVDGETDGNLGGERHIKTKSYQEFALLDIDPARLRGRVIRSAVLHLHSESKDIQRRLTVSTIASPWVEGTGTRYRKQRGSSSFNWAEQDVRRWAYEGSDITAVINGVGNTIWSSNAVSEPDGGGWQMVIVDPRVVAARAAGISHGFVVFDDIGSEYARDGNAFHYRQFPNRFSASRESRHGPYFMIDLGETDADAPGRVTGITSVCDGLPRGEAIVSWQAPADAMGFHVTINGAPAPRYLVPMGAEKVSMRLRDMKLHGTVRVEIRAVDATGNLGAAAAADVQVSDEAAMIQLAPPPVDPLGELADEAIAAVDLLDKLIPSRGEMVPRQAEQYMHANHLWSAKDRRVQLHAARNEVVGFQLVGRVDALPPPPVFDAPIRGRTMRIAGVATDKGLCPDPIVTADDPALAGWPVVVELYVAHDCPPGVYVAKLDGYDVDVQVQVWSFTLPDRLSFVPQMNCYSLPAPPRELAYYRLAHEHRTCLNRLPYNWRGKVHDGFELKWKTFDARFGPLLDGSAFADLPRGKTPVEAFYLPFNENWPVEIDKGFKGGYWPEEALDAGYRGELVNAFRGFAEHVGDKGWRDTRFEFYLNNKVSYKQAGWSNASAPWLFDEPAHTQDFAALRWFGDTWKQAIPPAHRNLIFRCDISRPQWQRDLLDGVMGTAVIANEPFHRYHRMIRDRQEATGQQVYVYGSPNAVDASNVFCAAWCIDAWTLGADGVLPWQTVGNGESWTKADTNSLFYPTEDGVAPSIRLKAFLRGQQDVEYFNLLAEKLKAPRRQVAAAVRNALGEHFDPNRLRPVDLWLLRMRVASMLDEMTK